MPIRYSPPNYGGGGNLLNSAIGVALSNQYRESPAQTFGRQYFLQRSGQRFQDKQRQERERASEEARIQAFQLGRQDLIQRGAIVTPEAAANLPYARGIAPQRTDLSLFGINNPESVAQLQNLEYIPQQALQEASKTYNPALDRFNAEGPLDPTSITPEEYARIPNREAYNNIVGVSLQETENLIDHLVEVGDPNGARQIQERLTGGNPLTINEYIQFAEFGQRAETQRRFQNVDDQLEISRQQVNLQFQEADRRAALSAEGYTTLISKDDASTLRDNPFLEPNVVEAGPYDQAIFELRSELANRNSSDDLTEATRIATRLNLNVDTLLDYHRNYDPFDAAGHAAVRRGLGSSDTDLGLISFPEALNDYKSSSNNLSDDFRLHRGEIEGYFRDSPAAWQELRGQVPGLPADPVDFWRYIQKNDEAMAGFMAAVNPTFTEGWSDPRHLRSLLLQAEADPREFSNFMPKPETLRILQALQKARGTYVDPVNGPFATVEDADQWFNDVVEVSRRFGLARYSGDDYEVPEDIKERLISGGEARGLSPASSVTGRADGWMMQQYVSGRLADGWVNPPQLSQYKSHHTVGFEFARMAEAVDGYDPEAAAGFRESIRDIVESETSDPNEMATLLQRMQSYLPVDVSPAAQRLSATIDEDIADILAAGELTPAHEMVYLRALRVATNMFDYGEINPIIAESLERSRPRREAVSAGLEQARLTEEIR